MGPIRQNAPQLIYEAAYDGVNNTTTSNQEDHDDLPRVVELEEDVPLLVGNSDSDDEDDPHPANIPSEELVHQYGNDHCIENDPVPTGSDRRLQRHEPIAPPPHEIEPDHFVVEKVINHKGTAARPGAMHLFVKWLGYDDSENSWIKWSDNQDLAAVDTYLANNPEIEPPIFPQRAIKIANARKKKRAANACNQFSSLIDSEKYYCNFIPAKCISRLTAAVADLSPFVALGAFRQVPAGTPRRYQDIERLPDKDMWIESTDIEFENMLRNTVWFPDGVDESTIPKNLILPSQLIFEKQFNPDGSLKKYKCRLVIRGDRWFDIYEMDTYASTVKSETVKICMAIAATEDMEMELVDVRSAFLYSPLKEDEVIYMRRPPGLTDSHMPKLVKLKKCIYGMKQASAYFHAHSDAVLKSFGCVPTAEDDCCYVLHHMGCTAIINKHVDDFGIMSKSTQLLTYIRSKLSEVYEITVDPIMKYYLGHHIVRDRPNKKIYLDQTAMINDMATKFNLPFSGPFPSTPMEYLPQEKNQQIFLDENGIKDYQSRVGSVLYIAMHSRPDILYATSTCTTKTKSPTINDLKAINRVITYLVGTKNLALKLGSDEGIVLYGTVDASYATHGDSKSHTGFTLHIGKDSGAIMAASKKQKVKAESSTIAEFIATHIVAKEILWCRRLLCSLGYPQLEPTILFEDNKSTISMIKNKCNGKRTKHIDVRYNLIRELCEKMVIAITYLSSAEMTSDTVTKSLAPGPFNHLQNKLWEILLSTSFAIYFKNI